MAAGSAVVIELKRDNHKLHLLQALSYAAMVAKWEPRRFVEELRGFNNSRNQAGSQSFDDAKEELEQVLEGEDIDDVNANQRVVLLAEEFDFQVLATCEWLTQKFDVDIRCYRVSLSTNGEDDFLSCTRVYPPPELTDIAIRRKRSRDVGGTQAADWSEAIATFQNLAERAFYEREIAARKSIKYRTLTYHIAGKRRFVVSGRRDRARVWQNGRFEGDTDFWKQWLGIQCDAAPLADKRSVRFFLTTDQDFNQFKQALAEQLQNVDFTNEPEDALADTEQ